MNWILLSQIIYLPLLTFTCMRIIYDTRGTTKTLAYLLAAVFLPFIGIIVYFSFGINYRKHKMYANKSLLDTKQKETLQKEIIAHSREILANGNEPVQSRAELVNLLLKDTTSPLTNNNKVELLLNGEKKFPEVLKAIENAKHHIHIEYYIFRDDEIGNTIEKLLLKKAKEGVKIRFIYDDYGSSEIRKTLSNRLREAGIEAVPFYKIKLIAFANRLNYRNHRKIIVIDGKIGFVGGINVSDNYINKENTPDKVYWRDTHLRIEGPAITYLQYLFLSDWNSCSEQNLLLQKDMYASFDSFTHTDNKLVQIAASGPDSNSPTILYSILQAIYLAEEEILITTPYFIPGESMLDALNIAAMSGLNVKLLVPYESDTMLTNAASRAYYREILNAGVEIYRYKKGFVHAKTIVTDKKIAIVGTANMDTRSYELNFEVNAIVYDEEIAKELSEVFYNDLKDAEKIDKQSWIDRPWYIKLIDKIAKLLSPML
ncbi:cardiolipin synthase [Cellulophaga fucicola]|uniref:cardiolipin synthase n=1 Tax=Cellulophaga fucicola TaxID=76595 RepID=UPI003EBA0615